MDDDRQGLTVQGIQYRVGDFVYLDPYTFTAPKANKKPAAAKKAKGEDESEEEDDDDKKEEIVQAPEYARKSGKHKGSNAGLKAFIIAQISGVSVSGNRLPSTLKVGVSELRPSACFITIVLEKGMLEQHKK